MINNLSEPEQEQFDILLEPSAHSPKVVVETFEKASMNTLLNLCVEQTSLEDVLYQFEQIVNTRYPDKP